jgi:hypothetical protein
LTKRLNESGPRTVAPAFVFSWCLGLGLTLLSQRPSSLNDLGVFLDPTTPLFWLGMIIPSLLAFSGAYGRYSELKKRASRDLGGWTRDIEVQFKQLTHPQWMLGYLGVSSLATMGFAIPVSVLFRLLFDNSTPLFPDVVLASASMMFPMMLLLRWVVLRSMRPFIIGDGEL